MPWPGTRATSARPLRRALGRRRLDQLSDEQGHGRRGVDQPHPIDVTDTSGPLWVSIDSTSATHPVRNVRVFWPGTEHTSARQPFNDVFLSRLAPFSTLRFMDWGKTNGSPVVEWADRAQLSDVNYTTTRGGIPIERMIDLANLLQADPWFCIPHQASDDYVRRFAALLLERLDPRLRPHVEYSNEVWNWGFPQTKWAAARSDELGLPRPFGLPSTFYANRAVEVVPRSSREVWGSPRPASCRARRPSGWTQFADSALAWKDTAAQADALAIAPYFRAEAAGDPKQGRHDLEAVARGQSSSRCVRERAQHRQVVASRPMPRWRASTA